jgi:hypothetical protein
MRLSGGSSKAGSAGCLAGTDIPPAERLLPGRLRPKRKLGLARLKRKRGLKRKHRAVLPKELGEPFRSRPAPRRFRGTGCHHSHL